MNVVSDLLESLENVRGPLTFWAFLTVVLAAAFHVFLTSTQFHKLWITVFRNKLSPTQFFRIARIFVVGLLVLLSVGVILAFLAPLFLQKMNLDAQNKVEGVELAISESKRTQQEYESAMRVFKEDRDYESALIAFRALEGNVKERASKDVIGGMITASLYALGKHREGLHEVCRRYREFPAASTRFRFDIHAHARRIALQEGYETSEAVLLDFRTRCRRTDFSPVWAGVPLVHMERLNRNIPLADITEYPIPEKDRDFLRYVIARYPTDAFVDHAKYFLRDFARVMSDHPQSPLLEPAMYSEIVSSEIGDAYGMMLAKAFLAKYSRSAQAPAVSRHLIRDYLAAGRLEEALATYEAHASLQEENKSILRDYVSGAQWLTPSIGKMGLDKVFAVLAAHNQISALCASPEFPISFGLGFMNEYNYEDIFRLSRQHALAAKCNTLADAWVANGNTVPALLAERKFDEALVQLDRSQKAFATYGIDSATLDFDTARAVVKTWQRVVTQGSVEARFSWAIAVRDRRLQLTEATTRVIGHPGWSEVLTTLIAVHAAEPMGPYADKSLYLIASLQRRMSDYTGAADTLQLLNSHYPWSPLLDDAACELALHELWFGDKSTAYAQFESVVVAFPGRNAADNALNWLAWSHLQDREYAEAAAYYVELASNYVQTRMGRRAAQTLEKLRGVLSSRRARAAIAGLTISGREYFDGKRSWRGVHVYDVVDGSSAGAAKIRYGDLICGVNDDPMDGTESSYYDSLQRALDEGRRQVRLEVLRGDSTMVLFAELSLEAYYVNSYEDMGQKAAAIQQ